MVQYMKVQLRELKIVNYRPLILGSKASLKPSPIKFNENRVKEKAREGKIKSHQYSSIETAPSLISKPHELRGGCTPKPKKLKKDSKSIIWGTVKVA